MKDDSEVNLIVEVKGYESEKDRTKKPAAQRWISAVNHHGGYGKWILKECRSPYQLPKILENTKREAEELYCNAVAVQ